MKRTRIILIPTVILLCFGTGAAHQTEGQTGAKQQYTYEPGEVLPLAPEITKGKLKNNLTYYIRENEKPEKRMELRLVVKAGSVLEDGDQQGIAHFIEHMAFNGTKHFKKQEIVDFLESIGMRFGPDINASTSFDEIIYKLQVPTDSVHIMEKAFLILEDWAHNMTFDKDEIAKESGVIIEEWRSSRGADARMRDKQLPVLFKGSRYAERLPIGKVEAIENFSRKDFRKFYKDWYRPDLMAVIAVGDFDKAWIEEQIVRHFSRLKSPRRPRERQVFPLPDHEETLFAIETDPEATRNSASIYYKLDVTPELTVESYRHNIVERIYNSMINQRLLELSRESEPPFLYGYSAKMKFILSKEMYVLGTGVRDNGIEKGLDALMTEAARAEQFGFTQTELDRQKSDMLRTMEQIYNERDKSESVGYADEYIRNFVMDEPAPGIEYEYNVYMKYVPGISLGEVNGLAGEWLSDSNRVILVNAPEKAGVNVPDEESVLAVINAVREKEIEPYVDEVSEKPFIEKPPTPSPVVKEEKIDEIGVTVWTLKNGVRVVLKPTDFKNDEILFAASSFGGHSLVDDKDFTAGRTAASVVTRGGVGSFNLIELEKMLSGKVVSVSPWIGSISEGISGNAAPADVETMFQLIYLYFTAPRSDSTAFLSFKSRMKGFIENRNSDPGTVFSDSVSVTMAQYHNRAKPWTLELLDEMNLDTSLAIYRDRFKDASDFTFFFIGNFEPADMKPLIETHLGGLPSLRRAESWRDNNMRYPKGKIAKEVRAGIEPKSQVSLIFTGDFAWSYQDRYDLTSMADVLRIKLRETLREDMGGTYGVGVSPSTSHYPKEEYRISISFGCAPDRVEELTAEVFTQIDSLRTVGTTGDYLAKVKETHRRKRETDLKENSFWLYVLDFYYSNDEDPLTVLEFDDKVNNLSLDSVREAARKYFDMENYVKLVLYPEEK